MPWIPLWTRAGIVRDFARVDAEDVERLSDRTWGVTVGKYAATHDGGYTMMHRELLGLVPGDGLEGDHINGNPLDNRRSNLRVATRLQNMQNIHVARGPSRFRGVSIHKATGLWRARVKLNGREHCIGYFRDEAEAGAAAAGFRREHMPYSEMDRQAA